MCVITTNARNLLHLYPGMATVLHKFYATDHKGRLNFVNRYLTQGKCSKNWPLIHSVSKCNLVSSQWICCIHRIQHTGLYKTPHKSIEFQYIILKFVCGVWCVYLQLLGNFFWNCNLALTCNTYNVDAIFLKTWLQENISLSFSKILYHLTPQIISIVFFFKYGE